MFFFFFNDTATTEIYTLSLHDALPICARFEMSVIEILGNIVEHAYEHDAHAPGDPHARRFHIRRSEEHTSELQSRQYLVCRLLLEKKKIQRIIVCTAVIRVDLQHHTSH